MPVLLACSVSERLPAFPGMGPGASMPHLEEDGGGPLGSNVCEAFTPLCVPHMHLECAQTLTGNSSCMAVATQAITQDS